MRLLLGLFVAAEAAIRAALTVGIPKRKSLGLVRKILAALRVRAVGTPDKPGAAWDAIAESYRRAARDAQKAQARDVAAPLGVRHQKTLEGLYGALAERLDAAIAHVAQDAERQFKRADEEIPEVKGFTDKAGRRWDLAVYARMCAQTTAAQAMSEATINRLLDEDEDLVQVSRHPHPEDACTPYEGRVFSISGKSERYPKLREIPPFHPNCKHRLGPFRQAPAARRDKRGMVLLDPRSEAVSVLEDGRVFVTPTPGVVELDKSGRVFFVMPPEGT